MKNLVYSSLCREIADPIVPSRFNLIGMEIAPKQTPSDLRCFVMPDFFTTGSCHQLACVLMALEIDPLVDSTIKVSYARWIALALCAE